MSSKRPTVDDLRNDPVFGPKLEAKIREINHEYDVREYRYCSARGIPISKALWKRLKKYRKEKS